MNQNIILAIFAGFLIILIICIFFQFLYIRIKLQTIDNSRLTMVKDTTNVLWGKLQTRANIRAYSNTLDTAFTTFMNTPGDFKNDLIGSIPLNQFILPYTCAGTVTPTPVNMPDVYFLGIINSSGGSSMITDLLNNVINYVVFSNKVYYIATVSNFQTSILQPLMTTYNITPNNNYNNMLFCYIFDLTTNVPVNAISQQCTFQLGSIFNDISYKPDNYDSYATFQNTVLLNSVNHVFGYNTI